jgi:hypothetical protein
VRQARQDELGKTFDRQMPLDFVRLGKVVAEGCAESHLGTTPRRHDGLVQSLATGGARTGTSNQRLAGDWQARHDQAQIQAGIADDDDASPHLIFLLFRHTPSFAATSLYPYSLLIKAYVSISVACLDDISPEELAKLPIKYMDGRHDNWFSAPKVILYL